MNETAQSSATGPGLSAPRPGEQGRWGLYLAAALVLGTLRFCRLGDWSLWLDEAYTLADAYHGSGLSNPLGYWAVRSVVELGGLPASEFDLRLLPAICPEFYVGASDVELSRAEYLLLAYRRFESLL